ncbi:hypothetical protein Salat_2730800 [Sesamum alatum]|uniref:Uncharacterized protein n=1 Tax=Sesamum alatum TaxID=300844 RepID=A0AAE1XJX7_9LAMI|nr:hypothetical protein Salat_2730800 [Sesamum alatum]
MINFAHTDQRANTTHGCEPPLRSEDNPGRPTSPLRPDARLNIRKGQLSLAISARGTTTPEEPSPGYYSHDVDGGCTSHHSASLYDHESAETKGSERRGRRARLAVEQSGRKRGHDITIVETTWRQFIPQTSPTGRGGDIQIDIRED